MGALDQIIGLADRVDRWAKRSTRPADDNYLDHLELESSIAVIKRLSTPSGPGPHPLVLTLHGFGSDEQQMATLVPLPQSGPGVHHVAVRGDWTIADGGFAWFPITGTNPANVTADETDINDACDRLAQIITALTAEPTIDDKQVWVIGYSQGAPMALHLLCRHPHLLRGIAVGAGSFIEPADPANDTDRDTDRDTDTDTGTNADTGTDTDLRGKHCFIAASTNDPFVPEARYAETEGFLRNAGAETTVITEHVPHVISTTQADAIDRWLAGLLWMKPPGG